MGEEDKIGFDFEVLIVDDCIESLNMIKTYLAHFIFKNEDMARAKEVLKGESLDISLFENHGDVFKFMSEVDGENKNYLWIIDIVLGEENGLNLAHHIRENFDKDSKWPILFISKNESFEDSIKLEFDNAYFLKKPFLRKSFNKQLEIITGE